MKNQKEESKNEGMKQSFTDRDEQTGEKLKNDPRDCELENHKSVSDLPLNKTF